MSFLELSIEDFVNLRNLIYERTGMQFGENKIYYFKKRVQKRMEEQGLERVSEYIRYLKMFDSNNREFQDLINLITVNETYFFREFSQLAIFAEVCLEEVVARKRAKGDRTLKIFSAACSTGEEPYTLAIILREMLDDFNSWKIMVKGVDIDENVLKAATRAEYDSRSVKDVPASYIDQHFTSLSGDRYRVNPDIRQMVTFEHVNLMDRRALRSERNYDFIFCRNMLIYFDDQSRKQVVERFYTMLNQGGFIFLGHAESLSRITTAFKIRRIEGFTVYQA
ncbi:MAG TPA: protein-glutamate O-methyltransferase CheR [Syntrophomonadaceae bacterium]|nr:protein-glutamate O-methyltransferase CheR [Syntrophomonadaceae bacterium]